MNSAEKEARLALNVASNRALAWSTLGTIRLKQAQYEESADFLNKALHLNPRLIGTRINLGNVYVLQRKSDQARAMFQSALALDPHNFNACFDLAKLEAESGQYHPSLEAAKPILADLYHSDEGLLVLAKDYLGLDQKAPAQSLVSEWKALHGVTQDMSLSFAALLEKAELVQEAIEVLEKARSSGEPSFELVVSLAGCYFKQGNLKQASENYEWVLSRKADCVACLRQIAEIAQRQGESDKTLAYLIRAKRLEPQNPDILFQFGKVCLERDLLEDALPVLQKAVELRPENPPYTYVLASAYVSKGDFKTARELLGSLLGKRPDDAVLNYAMGAVLFLELNVDHAEKYLAKSIRLNSNQLAAYYYLGLVLERKGEKDEAIRIWRDLLQRYPDHARTHEALGAILFREQKYVEAKRVLERAIILEPNSVKAHYQLGMLLARLGQREESDKQLKVYQELEVEQKKTHVERRILNPY